MLDVVRTPPGEIVANETRSEKFGRDNPRPYTSRTPLEGVIVYRTDALGRTSRHGPFFATGVAFGTVLPLSLSLVFSNRTPATMRNLLTLIVFIKDAAGAFWLRLKLFVSRFGFCGSGPSTRN